VDAALHDFDSVTGSSRRGRPSRTSALHVRYYVAVITSSVKSTNASIDFELCHVTSGQNIYLVFTNAAIDPREANEYKIPKSPLFLDKNFGNILFQPNLVF
jgi:hypothetical protein